MPSKVVYCLGGDENQTAELVNQLRLAGFTSDDVSALIPDKTGTRDFAYERHSKAPEGAVLGAGAGLLSGALGGWAVAIAGIDVSWLVHLTEAGPIMAALTGAAVAGIAGGFVGSLIGLAKPEFEARRYSGKLKRGEVLLSIHCDDRRAARVAKDICRQCGSTAVVTGRVAQAGGPS